MLRLADGSTVDVNERTELFVTAAWSGQAIHLQRGDVIVKAAKQRRGRLQVMTRDSIASVKGTVFAVSAGMGGSVVSVVEGSVEVNQPGKQVLLSPGQQAASIPALTSSVAAAVSWSPEAEHYLELLGSLAKIERGLADLPAEMRTTSALLSYLPAGAVVYGAVPNPGITIDRALFLAEEQAAQNTTFGAWWNSETGRLLKQMTERLQSVNSLLGNEIVFCASVPGTGEPVPMVMARVQTGKRAELTSALQGLFTAAGEVPASYSVSDDLMVVSGSPSQLAWALSQLGQGSGSPFAAAIGERYRRGVGWLVGMDAPPLMKMGSANDEPIELAGMIGMNYVFFEQRAPAGAVENEVTLAFQGARTGMASWLADAGSGGAAEYLPIDALVAGYVSTREPWQLFEEFTAQITRSEPDFAARPGEPRREARRRFRAEPDRGVGDRSGPGADGTLDQRSDVGHGGRGEQSGGHRQLASEAGGHVQRGAWARRAEQADRFSAGERGRTDLEHDQTGRPSARHHLDVRSGLHSGWPQIAASRSAQSRRGPAAHRSYGPRSSWASSPRLRGFTRPHSAG